MAKYKTIKVDKDVALEIEDVIEAGEDIDRFIVLHIGEWVVEHKRQWREIVVTDNEKYFRLISTRTGDYFSGYEYDSQYWGDFVELAEVEPKEVTTIEYVAVANED